MKNPLLTVVALAITAILSPCQLLAQISQQRSSEIRVTDSGEFRPNILPNLDVSATQGEIRIDGDLDDVGWNDAKRATSFAQFFPGDQTESPIGIEAWMTYDDERVYFAFVIEDDPQSVRSTLSDRDQIWGDDYVGVMLDTYGDNAWIYFLAVNPIGIQGDSRIINNGPEDESFDVVFDSEGRITESGYQVEMAVPFRSLRFPDREIQNWKINFWITHPRESRGQYTWAAVDRDDPCMLCQIGTLTGLRDIPQGTNIELLPALTGSQSGTLRDFDDPGLGIDNRRVDAEPSLGVKYAFSSNVVADAAINPDFSQVEADAAQVDVNTTFALFFPERRPFFQEGSDLFNTNINTVYTRSINNPIGVAKLTSRFGRTNVAYVSGIDQDTPIILPFEERSSFVQADESISNIVRVRRTFGTTSHIGALVTDRRLFNGGGAGSTFGVDGLIRLSNSISVNGQVVGSRTEEPDAPELTESVGDLTFNNGKHTAAYDGESFNGYAVMLGLNRNTRHWNGFAFYTSMSPNFRADNGFIFQNNTQQLFARQGYTFYLENGFVQRIQPSVMGGYWWNFENERKDQFFWTNLQLTMKKQTFVNFQYLVRSDEVFRDIDFRKLRRFIVNVNSNFSEPLKVGAFTSIGRSIARNLETPKMGNNRDFSAWATIKPHTRLVIEPAFNFASLYDQETDEEIFSGYILRSRTNFQFTRQLFLRLVTQYNDFNEQFEIDPLITYRINPFTAFYIGSTHDIRDFDGYGYTQTDRQLFFKFQYLVRV